MLRCTYIVLIHNNMDNIPNLIESLKKIKGDIRKEFIFVDDGSTDDSLNTLKTAVNDLPRTTIITQDTQGPTISINKASNLITGDYIHFVEGDEILHPQSTSLLIDTSSKLGTQVAIGMHSTKITDDIGSKTRLIETPLREILINKIPELRKIGKSGSLIHRTLLEKINKADNDIYTPYISLSLRCAKHSKFALIAENISFVQHGSLEQKNDFINHNTLKSIYNFAKANPDLFSSLKPELLNALSAITKRPLSKFDYSCRSFFSKFIKSLDLNKILQLYKQELDKLF